uniref:Uncharacterized protein n=1 Tax=Mola mola TaxID=94237 RepID=A0A3Q3X163_MOLML
ILNLKKNGRRTNAYMVNQWSVKGDNCQFCFLFIFLLAIARGELIVSHRWKKMHFFNCTFLSHGQLQTKHHSWFKMRHRLTAAFSI